MKRIFNIYNKLVVAAAVMCGTLMSSCSDYLTIIPPSVITEEHYWQTKDDVNGILATAYLKLFGTDAVSKAIIWGELRADNLTFPANNTKDIKYIVEANILDENPYCNWSIYYSAIQTANLVIERAPMVVDRDPDFTEGDLEVVLGEMYALRALAHFYLVRTFRDIPMARVAVLDDYEMPEYPQVHPLQALNEIMADLEKAQGLVMKSGNYSTDAENYGRITENAVLAIKADVNLWRAAFATYYEGESELALAENIQKYYDDCVQDCQTILDNMDRLYEENKGGKGDKTKYAYNLLQNQGEVEDLQDRKKSTVYDDIFGTKNSRESIFEFQVQGDNATNGSFRGIASMYGTEGKTGTLVVPATFASKNYEVDDLRAYSFTNVKSLTSGSTSSGSSSDEKNDIIVAKYTAKTSPAKDYRKSDEFDANWIVYRQTDVMLMMAEAMVARASAGTEDFNKAYDIVNAINTRSRMDTTAIKKPLSQSAFQSREGALELILKERLLELTFEGKRWYDLVRKALREKSTNNIKFVADKLESQASVVKSKMSTIDALFFPIHYDELRFNDKLVQNPAYEREDESVELN